MLLQVPQATRVVLNPFYSVRLDFVCLLVIMSSLCVLYDFHVSSANIGQYPASIEVVLRKLFELLNGLKAIIEAQVIVSFSNLSEQ